MLHPLHWSSRSWWRNKPQKITPGSARQVIWSWLLYWTRGVFSKLSIEFPHDQAFSLPSACREELKAGQGCVCGIILVKRKRLMIGRQARENVADARGSIECVAGCMWKSTDSRWPLTQLKISLIDVSSSFLPSPTPSPPLLSVAGDWTQGSMHARQACVRVGGWAQCATLCIWRPEDYCGIYFSHSII